MTSDDRPREPEADGEADVDIETIGVWEAVVEEGVDPHHDARLEVVACGRPRGTPKVYIDVDALERTVAHARADTGSEVAGVLLGRFYTSDGELVTDVRDTLRATGTRAGISHVTFSHDTWAAIFDQVDPERGEAIVGWYHSHPGFGVFLSRQDLFIQDNFFDGDGHVGLVVDPLKHEVGMFTRQSGRIGPAPGFWISAAQDQMSKAQRFASMLRYRIMGREPRKGLLKRLLKRLGGGE